ncbi:MAG: peptide chain release factor N(5)-glutamine methyltransferase [Coriobacteriaceae bacterium]|nr:peptide chain release factor N(5)-glutamine methyltransferase [Coriobacteriaceae bacterium]
MAERVWTVRDALAWTAEYLGRKGDGNPRRSAEWLLSGATGLTRVELYAHHDRPLSESEREAFREGIERRAAGEPLQYVTGEMPFRHLVLKVRPGVFIPRPETELLVEAGLDEAEARGGEVVAVDLCTGSGAVACALAQEVPGARVYATEISPTAAEVARENAERCGVVERVTVLEGDLFAPLPEELRGHVDVVLANPPYVPSGDLPGLPSEVGGHEPALALDGGSDGLTVARRIMDEARGWLRPGGVLAMELDERRVADADQVMRAWYEETTTVRDLTGRDRIVAGRTGRGLGGHPM